MHETAAYADPRRRPRVTVLRKLIWIEKPRFQGFGCSECSWLYVPSGPPVGVSLDAMKKTYEIQRDKEFSKHVCKPKSMTENRE
jgi:hypothetical protein